MKRITVNFTIRKTVKIITSILTIVLLVGLCLHESITVNAAESDDILEEYPYWIWYPSEQTLTVSKSTYEKTKAYDANGIIFRAPGADADLETTTFYYYYITPITSGDTVVLRYYDNLGIWQAEEPWELEDGDWIECPIGYQHQYSTSTLAVPVYTNGHTIATGSGTGITNSWAVTSSLPSDMPDVTIGLGDINQTINDALNATTSITTQANTIQSTVNSNLDAYVDGKITSSEMQEVIDTANTELNTLESQSGNTLADQIAINNAQNAVQIAQDKVISQELLDKISSLFNLSPGFSTISEFNEILSIYLYYYNEGLITKEQAIITGFGDGEESLPGLQTIYSELDSAFGMAETEADLQLLNSMTQIISQTMDNINSAGDLNKDIAESAKASMESEMDLVDSLLAETTQSLEQLTPQLTDTESSQALEWVGMIWENKFFKMVLPWCGIAMLLCLVLGVKYKI